MRLASIELGPWRRLEYVRMRYLQSPK